MQPFPCTILSFFFSDGGSVVPTYFYKCLGAADRGLDIPPASIKTAACATRSPSAETESRSTAVSDKRPAELVVPRHAACSREQSCTPVGWQAGLTNAGVIATHDGA